MASATYSRDRRDDGQLEGDQEPAGQPGRRDELEVATSGVSA